jgi:hypothetical protein
VGNTDVNEIDDEEYYANYGEHHGNKAGLTNLKLLHLSSLCHRLLTLYRGVK